MADEAKRRAKEEREREAARIRNVISSLYADGFADGASTVATAYGLEHVIPRAGVTMPEGLSVRLDLVDDAVNTYRKLVGKKGEELAAKGLDAVQLEAELVAYANKLAEDRSVIIAEMEHAQAKLDGAGNVMDEAGVAYEWRFPHFDLGKPHEECPICEAIREKAPYTQAEAEENGFPSHPHPGCDHGWVIVPVGEDTLTEKFPPEKWWARSTGSTPVSHPVRMPKHGAVETVLEKHVLVAGKWVTA